MWRVARPGRAMSSEGGDVWTSDDVLQSGHHGIAPGAALVARLRLRVLSDRHQADLIFSARSGRSVMRTATRVSRMNDAMSASSSTVHTQAGTLAPAQ